MRLVSVNVGLPKEVPWRGRTVRTAIFKSPVDGRRRVGPLNVDGDGQADLVGHGGEHRAVYAYDTSAYEHWSEVLGRDDLVPGHFGENFTVEGMPDDRVCVGDRYRIGDASFEVTQPRVTCFKVGLRLGEPRMPALLYSHGRPGFYMRVLEEGEVGAGDEIEQIAVGPEQMSVREASALLYLPGHSPAGLRRALAIPALSEGWRGSFRALLEQHDDGAAGNQGLAPPSTPPAWPGLREFRVTAARHESASVRSFVLEPVDGKALPAFLPGQFLALKLEPADAPAPLLRSYSLAAPADGRGFRIAVKREPDGRGSGFLHDRVAVGDLLHVGAPRGTFTLDMDDSGPVVLLSAGVGVTPVLAMLGALARAGSERPVWWIHGARSGAEHAFAAEVRDLLSRLPAVDQQKAALEHRCPEGGHRAQIGASVAAQPTSPPRRLDHVGRPLTCRPLIDRMDRATVVEGKVHEQGARHAASCCPRGHGMPRDRARHRCPGDGSQSRQGAACPGLRHQRVPGLHRRRGRRPVRNGVPQQRGGALDRRQPDGCRQHRRHLAAGPLVQRRRPRSRGRCQL